LQTEKVKKLKPVKVTAFVVTEKFAGKKELKSILVDLLYSAYRRENTVTRN